MNASSTPFADARTARIQSLTGDEIEVRPCFDQTTGRTVVQLSSAGFSVLLDNVNVSLFVSVVKMAALLGEVANVAAGKPTPPVETA